MDCLLPLQCYRSMEDALQYQMVTTSVVPSTPNPLLQMDGYSFLKLLPVMVVNDYEVLFITATKGV